MRAPRRAGLPPILLVPHREQSTPRRAGRPLEERGHALDARKPRFREPLPPTLAHHAGAVIFGGPTGSNGPDDFVRREIDWRGVPHRPCRAISARLYAR